MKTLIVEDDMMSQCLLAKILAERGHEVTSYDNAEQAILAYQTEFYPLLFVDVDLPGMDGLHFCKWVRAQPDGDKVFIMVATSSGQPEDLSEVLAVGANDFLPKPYDVGAIDVRLTVAEGQMQEFFERKALEDALRDSQQSCQRLFRTANDGAWLLNARFHTEYVSPQMAAMLGYQAEELADRAVIDFLPEPAHREAEQWFAQQREGGEFKKEIHFRRKDGSDCLALLSAAPVQSESGAFTGALWMVADLTGRKSLETELADTRKKFEGQLRDWTGELNQCRKSLQTESAERKKIEQTLQQQKDELTRTVKELKAEQAAAKQMEEALQKARADAELRSRQKAEELARAEQSLQAEIADRKRLAEVLQQAQLQSEARAKHQADELTRVREELETRTRALDQTGQELKSETAAHQRAEVRYAALLRLAKDLIAARTPNDAARLLAGVAHQLLGWDACSFELYSTEENKIDPILNIDSVNGRPAEVPPTYAGPEPSPIMQRVLTHGPQLILRSAPSDLHADYILFGDRARLSASLMYVPIRAGNRTVGFFSIQSYAPGAYQEEDLNILQTLADQGGGLLERIRAEQTQRHRLVQPESRPGGILETAPDGVVAIDHEGKVSEWNPAAELRRAQKMESIGQLAGGVAHDFNNLLGVVQGYSALLMEEKGLTPEATEALKQISVATERATHLTRQLLTVGHKQVIHLQTVDLNELINNVGKLVRRATGENIALQFNYSPSVLPMEADAGMMEQLVTHLANNARDAMPQGGQLTIATKLATIDEAHTRKHSEARPGQFVCLTVADTGCGMDEGTLERIFEPFFTTKPSGKASGLSLALVHGIVKQHQGWIEVQSRVGQGTTFEIFLPASSKPFEPPRPPENKPVVRGGKETILLVEDEPAVLAMATGILQRLGYQVVPAASGDEAASIWQRDAARIDLLLTDMVMPGSLNGRALAEKLSQEKPGLKVVYTSGYSLDLVGPGLATQENFNFVPKPYHPDELAQTVRNCLDGNVT